MGYTGLNYLLVIISQKHKLIFTISPQNVEKKKTFCLKAHLTRENHYILR